MTKKGRTQFNQFNGQGMSFWAFSTEDATYCLVHYFGNKNQLDASK